MPVTGAFMLVGDCQEIMLRQMDILSFQSAVKDGTVGAKMAEMEAEAIARRREREERQNEIERLERELLRRSFLVTEP